MDDAELARIKYAFEMKKELIIEKQDELRELNDEARELAEEITAEEQGRGGRGHNVFHFPHTFRPRPGGQHRRPKDEDYE